MKNLRGTASPTMPQWMQGLGEYWVLLEGDDSWAPRC